MKINVDMKICLAILLAGVMGTAAAQMGGAAMNPVPTDALESIGAAAVNQITDATSAAANSASDNDENLAEISKNDISQNYAADETNDSAITAAQPNKNKLSGE